MLNVKKDLLLVSMVSEEGMYDVTAPYPPSSPPSPAPSEVIERAYPEHDTMFNVE